MRLELLIVKDPYREVAKHRVRAFGPQGGDVGRSPDSFWVLPDPKGYVSSHHCSVEYRDGTYWLRDMSLNGVYLNDSREALGRGNEVPIRHGDHFRVAGYELVARLNRGSVKVAEHPHATVEARQEATGEHPTLNRVAPVAARQAADVIPGTAPDDPHAATTVMSDATYLADAGQAPHESSLAGPAGVDPAALHAPLTKVGQEPTHEADEADSKDWAASTQPNLKALAGSTVTTNGEDKRTQALPGLFGVVVNRLRTAFSSSPDAGESRFRKTGTASKSVLVPPPRQYRLTKLDEEVLTRNSILLGAGDNAALRAFKILRTRVRRRLVGNQWRSIGITGAGQGVGKTFTSINLAVALAQDSNSPTFLVDLDMYRPQVGDYLGMSFDKGLSDYLLGEATIEEIIYSPGVDGLAVIPNGRPLQNSSELLGTQRMADLVQFLEGEQPHRYVLYDMPPVMLSDDVLVFSPHVDCLLEVAAVGVTSRESLERSREILSEFNLLGVVLNRATERDHAGQYYYYY